MAGTRNVAEGHEGGPLRRKEKKSKEGNNNNGREKKKRCGEPSEANQHHYFEICGCPEKGGKKNGRSAGMKKTTTEAPQASEQRKVYSV